MPGFQDRIFCRVPLEGPSSHRDPANAGANPSEYRGRNPDPQICGASGTLLSFRRRSVLDSLAHPGTAALLRGVCREALLQLLSVLLLPCHIFVKFVVVIEVVRQARVNIS